MLAAILNIEADTIWALRCFLGLEVSEKGIDKKEEPSSGEQSWAFEVECLEVGFGQVAD